MSYTYTNGNTRVLVVDQQVILEQVYQKGGRKYCAF